MPLTQRGPTTIVIQPGEGASSYSEEDSSRHDSQDYSAEEDGWEDYEGEDDLLPSDSASASNEHPPLRTRAPRAPARRHHRVRQTQVHFQPPVHTHAPNPPSSVDHPDDYGYARGGYPHQPPGGGYYGGRMPGPGYHQNPHPGPGQFGGFGGGNQMIPYGPGYGHQNPFSPMSSSSGGSYFPEQHHRGMYDMMPYHQNPGYYAQQHHQLPAYMQQFQMSPPPAPPTEAPGQSTTPGPPDADKIRLEAELAAMRAHEEKIREQENQKRRELKIREDAEAEMRQRLDAMRVAQEEAKKEIEKAKAEAERVAREKMEAERRAEAERNRLHEEAMVRAEENARRKFEAEMKAAEDRRKQEEEARQKAEEAARIRLEAAIKAEAEAKAAADKKAAEEAERLKQIQEDAKRTAELEAKEKVEKEQAEAKAKAEADEKAKKDAEDLKKRIQEEAKFTYEEEAKKKVDNQPIRFTDAVGRKFSFPFHLCCTWQGMQDLINQAFQQVDVLGPHVREGHYDLTGPHGEIILPNVWEKVIQPDWSVEMKMWPMDKAPPLKHPMYGRHGIPHPGERFAGRGIPPIGRRPGMHGEMPIPMPPPGWAGGHRRPGTVPPGVEVVDARPPRKSTKSKAKPGVSSFLFGGKPAKKKSSKK